MPLSVRLSDPRLKPLLTRRETEKPELRHDKGVVYRLESGLFSSAMAIGHPGIPGKAIWRPGQETRAKENICTKAVNRHPVAGLHEAGLLFSTHVNTTMYQLISCCIERHTGKC